MSPVIFRALSTASELPEKKLSSEISTFDKSAFTVSPVRRGIATGAGAGFFAAAIVAGVFGAGAGVSVQPMGFLTITGSQVRLTPVQYAAPIDRVIDMNEIAHGSEAEADA